MVSTSASAVATSSSSPTVPMPRALAANWFSARITGRAMLSGTRFCRKYFSSALSKPANIGNAVNSASITVTRGTSAIRVVKVRLPAVWPRRSSPKRWRSVRRVSNQGQARSVSGSSRSTARMFWIGLGLGSVMLAMMPA